MIETDLKLWAEFISKDFLSNTCFSLGYSYHHKHSSSFKFMTTFFSLAGFFNVFFFLEAIIFSYLLFPMKMETFHLKHFLIPFWGRNFIISLSELTQMWNYHKFIYAFVILFHLCLSYTGCLLNFTRSLPFNESTTLTGFPDFQRKLQQHKCVCDLDIVCVKTTYEHVSHTQHMVLYEKKNQHKSAITTTLQKACEKSVHLQRETKQFIIWWGSSYFPESNWRVII